MISSNRWSNTADNKFHNNSTNLNDIGIKQTPKGKEMKSRSIKMFLFSAPQFKYVHLTLRIEEHDVWSVSVSYET